MPSWDVFIAVVIDKLKFLRLSSLIYIFIDNNIYFPELIFPFFIPTCRTVNNYSIYFQINSKNLKRIKLRNIF